MDNNYLPLSLKYKPKSFENILGQETITKYIQSVIKKQKIAFAYLFVGQQGVGKTTLARIMAKTINCSYQKITPCNLCNNCINIDLERSFNFYEIDATKIKEKDSICEIIENIEFAPTLSEYKICIIDEVHMLNINAFNSLLKVLEFPPSKTVFILSTTAIDKILPRLISRCQILYFRPIKNEDLAFAINKIAQNERLKITNKGMIYLLKIAQGSFRDALNILELFSIEQLKISSRTLSDKYLIPPHLILDLLIEKILIFNLIESLTIIHYIQSHFWKDQEIVNIMYNLLIKKYINTNKLHFNENLSFLSTKTLLSLLQILVNYKINNKYEYWDNIFLFLIKNQGKKIILKQLQKRKRIYFYVEETKIYSN
jgi:DNA polymerase-3 subunit gamma/tau